MVASCPPASWVWRRCRGGCWPTSSRCSGGSSGNKAPPYDERAAPAAVEEEAVPEPPAQPVTMAGDVWLIGRHRLICGDCRDAAVVEMLMAGASANVAITSPPYATQREYDPTSGFKPVPPEEY